MEEAKQAHIRKLPKSCLWHHTLRELPQGVISPARAWGRACVTGVRCRSLRPLALESHWTQSSVRVKPSCHWTSEGTRS